MFHAFQPTSPGRFRLPRRLSPRPAAGYEATHLDVHLFPRRSAPRLKKWHRAGPARPGGLAPEVVDSLADALADILVAEALTELREGHQAAEGQAAERIEEQSSAEVDGHFPSGIRP